MAFCTLGRDASQPSKGGEPASMAAWQVVSGMKAVAPSGGASGGTGSPLELRLPSSHACALLSAATQMDLPARPSGVVMPERGGGRQLARVEGVGLREVEHLATCVGDDQGLDGHVEAVVPAAHHDVLQADSW